VVSRRRFLTAGLATGGALAIAARLRGSAYGQPSETTRPSVPWGVQCGDVTASSAVIWSATDRPARMLVE
jgi:alkaline phosphatase D